MERTPPKMIAQWAPSTGVPGFVTTLYDNILDREPESQDAIERHSKHAYVHGLVDVEIGFFESEEYRSKTRSVDETVTRLYGSIMGRVPGSWEVQHQVGELARGGSIHSAVVGFMQSTEYSVRCGLAPHPRPNRMQDFIMRLYVTILDRNPENPEVIASHANSAHAEGLVPVINHFIESPEYCAKQISRYETIHKLYRAILSREPDIREVENRIGEMDRGRNLSKVVRLMVEDELRADSRQVLRQCPLVALARWLWDYSVGSTFDAHN
jgi:hypothetical protein